MRKMLLPFSILTFITTYSFAQVNFPSSHPEPDTISMTLTEHNNIVINALVNEMDTLKLMLHTAVNSISLTKKAIAEMSSMVFTSSDSVQSWGGKSISRNSENNRLRIGRFYWDSLKVWESEFSGHHTDGKFGLNLFTNKVVELDFVNQQLIIHTRLPENIDSYHLMRITNENGLLFVEGTCKIGTESFTNQFLIHSGYSGSILLADDFVSRNHIGEKTETVNQRSLKDSYGNEIRTIDARLPAFDLGEHKFFDIPVSFFEGAINRQKMSVLGGDLLKKFNIIFDLDESTIYLYPNQLFEMPYAQP